MWVSGSVLFVCFFLLALLRYNWHTELYTFQVYVHVCAKSLQSCPTLCDLWTIACQALLSMGILQARILEWVACYLPGDLPDPGIKPTMLFFFCFSFFYFLFIYFFISWRLIILQYCSGFCHTLTWISHRYTCIPHPDPPFHLPLHPIPLGLPSAPGPSTCLIHSTWAGDLFHPR